MSDTPDSIQDILKPDPGRFSLFPIRDREIWRMYKEAEASFWTAEEVDLAKDPKDWETRLTQEERRFVSMILAFFATSDGIVNENLLLHLAAGVQLPEARCFYGFQVMMENIHAEMYSLTIDVLIHDTKEKQRLFSAIRTIPSINLKAQWALRWIEQSDSSYAQRLVAFAAVEGIFFSASFAAIFWLRKRGLLPGLTFSNDLISRDEGMHVRFACLLHSRLVDPLPADVVRTIIAEAVDIEKRFVEDALSVSLIGMNSKMMQQYVEYVADCLLFMLGQPLLFRVSNPFDFMDMISMEGKTNFFEKRVPEYAKASVAIDTVRTFSLAEDF